MRMLRFAIRESSLALRTDEAQTSFVVRPDYSGVRFLLSSGHLYHSCACQTQSVNERNNQKHPSPQPNPQASRGSPRKPTLAYRPHLNIRGGSRPMPPLRANKTPRVTYRTTKPRVTSTVRTLSGIASRSSYIRKQISRRYQIARGDHRCVPLTHASPAKRGPNHAFTYSSHASLLLHHNNGENEQHGGFE